MRRFATVLLAVALVLTATMTSAQAAKKKYVVTITAPTTGEVGKALTLRGTVVGTKANGKPVLVQRRAGSAWVTVAKPIVRKGKWRTSIVPGSGGATRYRAVKPKSSTRKQGVSSTRTVTVYRWLWLSQQPAYAQDSVLEDITATVNGVRHPHSLMTGDNLYVVKLGGLCTQVTTGFGFADETTDPAPTGDFATAVFPLTGVPGTTPLTDGVLKTASVPVSGAKFFGLSTQNITGSGPGTVIAALTSPRAWCAADALPSFTYSELAAAVD